jgi:hypothetical protein
VRVADLLYRCCTSTKESLIGMSLLRWQLEHDVNCCQTTTISLNSLRFDHCLPPAWSCSKGAMITGNDLGLSFIFPRVRYCQVSNENRQNMHFRLKTWKSRQTGLKLCADSTHFFWSFNWNQLPHSQSRDTIPLRDPKMEDNMSFSLKIFLICRFGHQGSHLRLYWSHLPRTSYFGNILWRRHVRLRPTNPVVEFYFGHRGSRCCSNDWEEEKK